MNIVTFKLLPTKTLVYLFLIKSVFFAGQFQDLDVLLRPLIPKRIVKFLNGGFSTIMKASLLVVTDRGDLLYYYKDEVKIVDTHNKLTKGSLKVANLVSLAQSKENIFIAAMERKRFICSRFDYKLKKEATLCNFPTERQSEQQMVVNESELTVIENSSYHFRLRVYNFSGSLLRTVRLREKALQISPLPQGRVLIKHSDLRIASYDITADRANEIWRSEDGYNFVSTDSAGLCYCNSYKYNSAQEIQLVTADSSSGKFYL